MNATHDVFLSYSKSDRDVVREVAVRLRGDGVSVWFDEWEIKIGDSVPSKIEEGLENSRALALFMSANAFGSDWAHLESLTFRFRDALNRKRRFIPVRLDDAEPPGSLKQFRCVDWRRGNRDGAYEDLRSACRPPSVPPESPGSHMVDLDPGSDPSDHPSLVESNALGTDAPNGGKLQEGPQKIAPSRGSWSAATSTKAERRPEALGVRSRRLFLLIAVASVVSLGVVEGRRLVRRDGRDAKQTGLDRRAANRADVDGGIDKISRSNFIASNIGVQSESAASQLAKPTAADKPQDGHRQSASESPDAQTGPPVKLRPIEILLRDNDPRVLQAYKACEDGRLEVGIALLAQLFIASSDAIWIYNQGRCYKVNRRCGAASSSFSEYLRLAKELPREKVAEVRQQIASCSVLPSLNQRRR